MQQKSAQKIFPVPKLNSGASFRFVVYIFNQVYNQRKVNFLISKLIICRKHEILVFKNRKSEQETPYFAPTHSYVGKHLYISIRFFVAYWKKICISYKQLRLTAISISNVYKLYHTLVVTAITYYIFTDKESLSRKESRQTYLFVRHQVNV